MDDRRMLLFEGAAPARLVDHVSGQVTLLDTIGQRGIVSPDVRLAVTQPENPGPVRIVDLGQPKRASRSVAFAGTLGTAAFTPDGNILALGTETGEIRRFGFQGGVTV